MEHQLNAKLQQTESTIKMQLEAIKAQLDKDGQVENARLFILTLILVCQEFMYVFDTEGFSLLLK